jgi:hypothetical protein
MGIEYPALKLNVQDSKRRTPRETFVVRKESGSPSGSIFRRPKMVDFLGATVLEVGPTRVLALVEDCDGNTDRRWFSRRLFGVQVAKGDSYQLRVFEQHGAMRLVAAAYREPTPGELKAALAEFDGDL